MKTAVCEKVETEGSEVSMGQKLRKFRKSTGLNCAEFARELGVNPDVITRIEADKDELTAEILIKMAVVFGCDINVFLTGYLSEAVSSLLSLMVQADRGYPVVEVLRNFRWAKPLAKMVEKK